MVLTCRVRKETRRKAILERKPTLGVCLLLSKCLHWLQLHSTVSIWHGGMWHGAFTLPPDWIFFWLFFSLQEPRPLYNKRCQFYSSGIGFLYDAYQTEVNKLISSHVRFCCALRGGGMQMFESMSVHLGQGLIESLQVLLFFLPQVTPHLSKPLMIANHYHQWGFDSSSVFLSSTLLWEWNEFPSPSILSGMSVTLASFSKDIFVAFEWNRKYLNEFICIVQKTSNLFCIYPAQAKNASSVNAAFLLSQWH